MWLFDALGKKQRVTLAIESSDMRFLTMRGNQVLRWGEVPLPDGLVQSGVAKDTAELGQRIDDLFRREELPRDQVITAISGMRAIPRILTLPKLRASMLEQAISREARKEMPVSTDDLYLSWQTLPSEGDQQHIYLLGVPRELVDSQIAALEVASVTPYAADLKPLALVRAVGKEEAIIVSLERNILDLVLVHEGLPTIMRTFDTNGAEHTVQERIDQMMDELRQTVRFYNDGHSKAPIAADTPICASGKLFAEVSAREYLEEISERPLASLECPLNCPSDLPRREYITNIGLALKDVS